MFYRKKVFLKYTFYEHLVAWPEIPRPGNYHVIECVMKGFCEWFSDMPIMV